MKRWTLRIVLLLVLGCVTTVAVAWGCGLGRWEGFAYRPSELSGAQHQRWWRSHVPTTWNESFGSGVQWHGIGLTRLIYNEHPEGVVRRGVARDRAGWPFRSLESWAVLNMHTRDTTQSSWKSFSSLAVHLPRFGRPYDSVPTGIIWPGFLIDALFYGVIWFGIFLGFGSARRAIRKKRGRCPKCGYELRGQLDAGCSECGWNRPEGAQ